MKLLTTSKIDIPTLFFEDPKEIEIKLLKKVKGKQSYQLKQVLTSELTRYILPCQYLIHMVLSKTQYAPEGYFVNLSQKEIDTVITNKHHRYIVIQILDKLGIIEVNNKYSNDKGNSFTKSYRINSTYTGYLSYLHITDSKKAITNNRDTKTRTALSYVAHPSNINKLHFKSESALNYLHNQYIGKANPDIIKQQIAQLDTLYQKKSKSCGRIFTSINSLKKAFRKFITDTDGNSLLEIDYSTSNLLHFLKQVEMLPKNEGLINEINTFKGLVLNGDFYQWLTDQINLTSPRNKATRDNSKKIVQYWLSSSFQKWKSVKMLNELFPTITEYIKTVNRKGKKNMLIMLMKSEARLVNDIIIERINKELPSAIVFNLFDGFMIDQNNYLNAMDIATTESGKYFGFEVRHKLKLKGEIPNVSEIKPVQPLTGEALKEALEFFETIGL